MADLAKLRTEDVVPDLEQMEKIRLFDKAEIRAIAKKRKEFEYKIQRRMKCKEDYLRYIKYELDLLKCVRERKDKIGVTVKKADIELAITGRVDKLFQQVTQRFKSDVRLWTHYIKFCKQVGFISVASSILMKMVTVHRDKPNIWKMAASWEFTVCHSIENARKYLLRGLRLHPESKVLYEEAFQQELNFASMKRKQKAEEDQAASASGSDSMSRSALSTGQINDRILEGRLAEVVYETAIHKVDNVNFYIDLLSVAKEFDFTDKLQNRIVNHLLSKYRNDELSWDTMARRELEGFTYSPQIMGDPSSGAMSLSPRDKKKTCLKERIRLCTTVYTAIVKQLNTERMWSLYLETLIELNQDLVNLPTFKQKLLKSAFQDAHSAGRLQEKYYLQWVDLLQSTSKFNKVGLVLRQATERFSSNVELWQMRLRFHLARDEECLGINVFQQATTRLATDSEATLPLWKNLIQYYQTKDIDKAEEVFENGIKLGTSVSNSLKPLFLEWLLLMKGMSAVYKEYEFLSLQPPMCLELHLKMIALENMQPDMNVKFMRKCYDVASRQFGRDNADIWLEYAKFELDSGDPKNVEVVCDNARKILDSINLEMFYSEFALLQSSMPVPLTTA